MSPISTNLNVCLGDATMADEEPQTEDGLRKDVKNSICENFRVDGGLAGTIGEAPHTE